MFRNPNFVRVSDDDFINDFLILQLNESSTQPVIKLNRHDKIPTDGQSVIAMGMGNTDPDVDESRASILQQVQLNVISNNQCALSNGRDLTYEHRIFPSMMCTTGGPHNERDAWYVSTILSCSGTPKVTSGANMSTHSFFLAARTIVVAPSFYPEQLPNRICLSHWCRGEKSAPIPTFQVSSLPAFNRCYCSAQTFCLLVQVLMLVSAR